MPVVVEVMRVFVDKMVPAIDLGDEPNGMLGMDTILRSTLSAATMQLVDRDPPAALLSQGAPSASPTSKGGVDDDSNHTLAIEESVAPLDSQVCCEILETLMTLLSTTRAEYTLVGSLANSKNITGFDGVASDVANDSSPFGRVWSHKLFIEGSMANEAGASVAFTKTRPHGEAKLSAEL